jgi:hypothetical protein
MWTDAMQQFAGGLACGRLLKNNYMSLASKFYRRVYLLEIVSN